MNRLKKRKKMSHHTNDHVPILSIGAQDVAASLSIGSQDIYANLTSMTGYLKKQTIIKSLSTPNSTGLKINGVPTTKKEVLSLIEGRNSQEECDSSEDQRRGSQEVKIGFDEENLDTCDNLLSHNPLSEFSIKSKVQNMNTMALDEVTDLNKIWKVNEEMSKVMSRPKIDDTNKSKPTIKVYPQVSPGVGIKYIADESITTKWMTRIPFELENLKSGFIVLVMMKFNDIDFRDKPVKMCSENLNDRKHDGRTLCECIEMHRGSNFCVLTQGSEKIIWNMKSNPAAFIRVTKNVMCLYIAFMCRNSCLPIRHVKLTVQVFDNTQIVLDQSYPIRVCASPIRDHYTYTLKANKPRRSDKSKSGETDAELLKMNNHHILKSRKESTYQDKNSENNELSKIFDSGRTIFFYIEDIEKETAIVTLIRLMGGFVYQGYYAKKCLSS